MSKTESSAVVVPTTEGKPDMGSAAGVAKMSGGGLVLTPLPLSGGRRTRKSRKISKKVLKQLKKMGTKKVMKMLKKGGQMEGEMTSSEPAPSTGARRRSRRSRRGLFY